MAFDIADRMELDATTSGNMSIVYALFADGRRKILANLIKMDAKIEYGKTQYPILGLTVKPSKKGPGTITGSMTLHYNTSVWRECAMEYKKTGKDTYFDLQIVNDDPDNGLGKQSVILYGVNFDSIQLALVDAEAEYLTEELAFTANDWDLESSFAEGGMKNA